MAVEMDQTKQTVLFAVRSFSYLFQLSQSLHKI
jgi:hypothetical protein